MHRDTIVGIVGATVLVAVMVAVFVYEYNQAEAATDGGDGAGDGLPVGYTTLNATEDIDGDGTPNLTDKDIDEDGADNANDTVIATHFDLDGQVAQSTTPNQPTTTSQPLFVGTGAVHAIGYVNYTLPAPAPLGSVFALSARLVGPDGEVAATGEATTPATGETAVSIEVELTGITPGEYTLEVTRNQAGQAIAFQAPFDVHYAYDEPDGLEFEK